MPSSGGAGGGGQHLQPLALLGPSRQPPVSWRNPHGDEAGTAPGLWRACRVGLWRNQGACDLRVSLPPSRPGARAGPCGPRGRAHRAHLRPAPPRLLQSSPRPGRAGHPPAVSAPWAERWGLPCSKQETPWEAPQERLWGGSRLRRQPLGGAPSSQRPGLCQGRSSLRRCARAPCVRLRGFRSEGHGAGQAVWPAAGAGRGPARPSRPPRAAETRGRGHGRPHPAPFLQRPTLPPPSCAPLNTSPPWPSGLSPGGAWKAFPDPCGPRTHSPSLLSAGHQSP